MHDALVIGAGPAGLATSRELSRLGVSHVVIDRGDQPGYTWANLYDSLVLHTARRLSALPGLPYPSGTRCFPTRADVLAYLHRYAATFRVRVETRVEVVNLHRADGGWIARTTCGGEIRARAIVVATGIVSNPYVPEIPERDRFSGRVFHSVEYRRPHPFTGQRVLVAGAGNSAAEIAVELANAGAGVTLAVRSGNSLFPRTLGGIPIQYFALAASSLPLAAQRITAATVGGVFVRRGDAAALAGKTASSRGTAPLIGCRVLASIRNGTIRLKGGIAQFTSDGVQFSDGSEEPFDAVILATGYRAAVGMLGGLIHLDECGFGLRRDGVISVDQPNLYFVGHNYDIRGALFNISRDAVRAARSIQTGALPRTGTPTRTLRASGTPPPARSLAGPDAPRRSVPPQRAQNARWGPRLAGALCAPNRSTLGAKSRTSTEMSPRRNERQWESSHRTIADPAALDIF